MNCSGWIFFFAGIGIAMAMSTGFLAIVCSVLLWIERHRPND